MTPQEFRDMVVDCFTGHYLGHMIQCNHSKILDEDVFNFEIFGLKPKYWEGDLYSILIVKDYRHSNLKTWSAYVKVSENDLSPSFQRSCSSSSFPSVKERLSVYFMELVSIVPGIVSWCGEFYPVKADEAAKGSDLDALQHSLKKWEGLKNNNLLKHRLITAGKVVCEADDRDRIFRVDTESCALCKKYLREDGINACDACPLFRVRGTDCNGPFLNFVRVADPEPMIELIKLAIKSFHQPKRPDWP